MIIIPAVDIKDGKCVRLLQGRMNEETVFSDDPAEMAKQWNAEGAELIHVVDLDGAFAKSPQNLASIKKILASVDADIQIGGGIRNEETIRMYIDLGVKKIVIGTEAIRNPSFVIKACEAYPGQIVLGIDAKDGMAAIEGWAETTQTSALDLAKQFEGYGIAAINFTDIIRDGMQTGPNIEQTKRLAQSTLTPIVASGGVSTIRDIKEIKKLEAYGVVGVITGRALYSGTLSLKEAIKVAKQQNNYYPN
ncbi:MAG: 1-(5-phosphoribosyl)-5-[(5-phosphoribosylamino)methylideneamino]imidazole-4-carboxamide isomerase [Desulfobacterales bacterium]|nr:1-(5-phosphoribosyl)-5-[(5-phosphoribosylamino)methylideneamino]imidazole-4-carboxamide isomerase [Desulfobacterales bacterium]